MKDLVKDILAGNSSRNGNPALLNREKRLYMDLAKIQVVIGPRRVGKTSIMQLYMQELKEEKRISSSRLIYFNFEDERVTFSPEQLDIILQAWQELYPEVTLEECYFFFDEVQATRGWEKFINRINETITKKICFTGSNSRILHTEVNTALRGRSIPLEILPLSFSEYCDFHHFKPVIYGPEKSKTEVLFNSYLNQGGYPELIGLQDEGLRIAVLQEYFNTMLLRDIVDYNQIGNFQYLRPLLKLVASSVGKPVSIRRFFNHLKSMGYAVGINSVYDAMNHAEDAYLFKRIGRYDYSSSKSEKSDKKIYWLDNGLLRAITGMGNRGTLLENIVFLHLHRTYGSVYQSQIFYYSDQSHECDFIVLRPEQPPLPIQVCWTMEQFQTRDREIKGLLKACKYAVVKEGLILTLGESAKLEQDGVEIQILPAWKWMLENYGKG